MPHPTHDPDRPPDRPLLIKIIHPDLIAHVRRQAEDKFMSPTEYIRRLIVEDFKQHPVIVDLPAATHTYGDRHREIDDLWQKKESNDDV